MFHWLIDSEIMVTWWWDKWEFSANIDSIQSYSGLNYFVLETNQIEDPRLKWRDEQEKMLREYLADANQDLMVKNLSMFYIVAALNACYAWGILWIWTYSNLHSVCWNQKLVFVLSYWILVFSILKDWFHVFCHQWYWFSGCF